MTEYTSGCSFSTASETAVTSCTNLAPIWSAIAAAARAGHEHARVVAVDADLGFHPLQELQRLLRLLGFVALVVLPEHLVAGGIDHDRLHRGRAHVQADQELGLVIVRLVRMRLAGLEAAAAQAVRSESAVGALWSCITSSFRVETL